MPTAEVISLLALGVAAIGFFYKIGRDSLGKGDAEDDKLDMVLSSTKAINEKLDDIAKWQRDAAAIHATQAEQLQGLNRRVTSLEDRMEDRAVMNESLKGISAALIKVLEKVG